MENQERSTAIVRRDSGAPERWELDNINWQSASSIEKCYTSYDLSKPAERKLLYKVMTGDPDNPSKHINKVLEVVNITVWPISFESEETGEQVDTLAVDLELKGGNHIQFHSAGIWRSVGLYMTLVGMPPYKPPAKLLLVRRDCRGGKSFYGVQMAEDDARGQ